MITKRNARLIRGAIKDARKFAWCINEGWAGLESRNLTGLYGRAYERALKQAMRGAVVKRHSFPPGFCGRSGTP